MSGQHEDTSADSPGEPSSGLTASNDQAVHDDSSAVTPPVAADVGTLLRTAREQQGFTVSDIAGKLRMGVKQVSALECGDYTTLPTGTFLRGFVRNYAKAVNLNSEEVIALLEKTHRGAASVAAASVVVPMQQNIAVKPPGGDLATPKGRMIIVVAIAAALAGAVWYWWEYVRPAKVGATSSQPGTSQPLAIALPVPSAGPVPTAASPDPAIPVQPAATAAADSVVPGAPTQSGIQSTTPTPAATAVPAPATAAAPTQPGAVAATVTSPAGGNSAVPATVPVKPLAAKAGGVALGFTFTGDSWVEVVDAGGKTLLSKRFKAGDAEEISGRAPLSVVVGNAQVTRMAFNGREFDLAPHTRVSVARVSVK